MPFSLSFRGAFWWDGKLRCFLLGIIGGFFHYCNITWLGRLLGIYEEQQSTVKPLDLSLSYLIHQNKFMLKANIIIILHRAVFKWRACFQNLLHPVPHVTHFHNWLIWQLQSILKYSSLVKYIPIVGSFHLTYSTSVFFFVLFCFVFCFVLFCFC